MIAVSKQTLKRTTRHVSKCLFRVISWKFCI